jgi:SMC interacting uncharacterized protein involved in chromosome segregation
MRIEFLEQASRDRHEDSKESDLEYWELKGHIAGLRGVIQRLQDKIGTLEDEVKALKQDREQHPNAQHRPARKGVN